VRRAAILLLLLGAMRFLTPLEAGGGDSTASRALMVFGFLILAAYTVGELAKTVRLPKITGYLAAGLVFGPSALGVVTSETVEVLAPVSRLAVALIAFLAGAELRWEELKERGRAVLGILLFELPLAFILILTTLLVLRPFVPFFTEGSWAEMLVLGSIFASVTIVHSPAVTMALLSETGARGPVARTTLGVVLVTDVVVVLVFSGVVAAARTILPPPGGEGGVEWGMLVWEIGGSVLIGALLGGAVALYLRFVQRELFLFAIIVTFFGSEIARLAHVETLLTLLVAGFLTESLSGGSAGRALLHAMERSAAPVFVVFFALAGASIHVQELVSIWPLALAIVAARALGIWGGTRIGTRWAKTGPEERRYAWMGLISQAGVAIGLASIAAEIYPERGEALRTLLLAVITINEVAGQILFRVALGRSGEVSEESHRQAPAETTPAPAAG
jgi:Kef-type K+ transport system membrane component KefB